MEKMLSRRVLSEAIFTGRQHSYSYVELVLVIVGMSVCLPVCHALALCQNDAS